MSIADVDITVARQWGFADTGRERLSGELFPADFDADIEPGWEIFALSFRRSERTFRGLPPVLVGRTVHFLHKPKKRRGVFVREGGCVRLAFVDLPGELLGSPVRVLHISNGTNDSKGVLHINGSDSTDTLRTQQDVWYSDSVSGNVTYNFAIA